MADVGQEGKDPPLFLLRFEQDALPSTEYASFSVHLCNKLIVLCRGLRGCQGQGVEDRCFCLLC